MDATRFIELAQTHAGTDYGSARAVRQANLMADELRSMAMRELGSPQGTEELLVLLNHPVAVSWIAYTALERGDLTEFQSARCLAVVRGIAAGESLSSVGARAWLAQNGYGG